MNRSVSIPFIMLLAASTGCAKKSYVREQVTPIINKVNQLDDLTAQNTRAIKETDDRLKSANQQADASADAADQKAQGSTQQVQQAQTSADNAVRRVDTVQKVIASSDDYRVVNEATVQFAIDRYDLTSDAKEELDRLASTAHGMETNIICIEGFTDSTGMADDNYSLSSQRANTVKQYFATQYNVPVYRIHTIGLGPDNPVAPNTTGEGRAKNRRAKVQLMSNSAEGTATAAIR